MPRKGIWSVQNWVLVCWWWHLDWSFARLVAPVVNTGSSKIQKDIPVLANPDPPGKWPLKWREGLMCASKITSYGVELWSNTLQAKFFSAAPCIVIELWPRCSDLCAELNAQVCKQSFSPRVCISRPFTHTRRALRTRCALGQMHSFRVVSE